MRQIIKTRYSVSTLLLITTVVAMLFSTILTCRYIAHLKHHQQEVMKQTGYIDVVDPSKVYVRNLFCFFNETWKIEIYTPFEHELMWGIGTELDDEHYPTRLLGESYFRRSGQTTITISLFNDRNDRWRISRYYPYNGSNLIIPHGDFSWVLQREYRINAGNGGEPVHGKVRVYDIDERIPIFVLKDEDGSRNSMDTSGSIMVWFEPNLKSTFRSQQADRNPALSK